MLEDRAGKDVRFLADNTRTFMEAARKRPEIGMISTTLLADVPQVFADVDRDKTFRQGISVRQVYNTLQAFMGGLDDRDMDNDGSWDYDAGGLDRDVDVGF